MNDDYLDPEQLRALRADHELAYLRGDLAASSPESYSIEEMQTIYEDMQASTAEIEAAIKADFESQPPEMKAALLDMLGRSGVESRAWWEKVLCGFEVPDGPPEEEA